MNKLFYLKIFLLSTLINISSNKFYAQNPIQSLRYQDENLKLKQDSTDFTLLRNIKQIPFSKQSQLYHASIGGETRQRYLYFHNSDFGDASEEDYNGYLLQRYMLHMDLVFGNHFRVFSQLTSNFVSNKDIAISTDIDINHLDVFQLFLDSKFNVKQTALILRVGRQEVKFGSGLMMDLREGPNVRKSYDGFSFHLNKANAKMSALLVRPVNMNIGIFDDRRNDSQTIWGVYSSFSMEKDLIKNMDIYYLGNSLNEHTLFLISGKGNRHSLGIRIDNKKNDLKYNTEFVYQFGNIAGKGINAFLFSNDIKFQIYSKNKVNLGLNTQVFSGDKDGSIESIGTFAPIETFPPALTSVKFGSSNLIILNPYIQFSSFKKLQTKIHFFSLWRYSIHDALYNVPISAFTRPTVYTNTEDRHVLYQVALDNTIDFNKHFSLLSLLGYVLPREFVKNTGNGLNSFTLKLQLSYKF